MERKEYLKKVYRHFSDFIAIAAARELEFFILDSKFTSGFNLKMKEMFESIKQEGKDEIEFSIWFNTENEVVLIDANLLGRYIANMYTILMEEYYKDASINKVVRQVINGTEKSRRDFISISYIVLYKSLEELYKEVKYKREILNQYKLQYSLQKYQGEDIAIVVLSLLILEDICKYLGIENQILTNQIGLHVMKEKNSQ